MRGYVIHAQLSAKAPVIPVNDPMGLQVFRIGALVGKTHNKSFRRSRVTTAVGYLTKPPYGGSGHERAKPLYSGIA